MERRLLRRKLRISRNTWVLLLIIALVGIAIWVLTPIDSVRFGRQGMRLGLDLKGGVHLVYQADLSGQEDPAGAMEGAIRSIRARIDEYGVTEPVLQKQGNDRILVQLPGITDVEEAKRLIEQTAFLEFREVELNNGNPVYLSDYLNEIRTTFFDESDQALKDNQNREFVDAEGAPLVFLRKGEESLKYVDKDGNPVDVGTLEQQAKEAVSWMPATGKIEVEGEEKIVQLIGGGYLTKASPQYPQQPGGEIGVSVEWNDEGADIFDQIAACLYDRGYGTLQNRIGMFLDDELISSPGIKEREYHGKGFISGNFTWDEARRLATQLRSGALPVPLEKPPLYEKNVSATLGADFIKKAVLAGVIGLLVVMLFMILYYRLPGVVASLALLIYAALVLAVFKLIPVTLTLAGIAGFVVSLGMAVDANVLIFERVKEELRGGRTLKAAVEAGFSRAWPAIRDSNVTTFIACGILYWFGHSIVASAAVMGFAVTLFIGVAVSMFSAITITRTFLLFFTGAWATRRLSWFGVEAKNV